MRDMRELYAARRKQRERKAHAREEAVTRKKRARGRVITCLVVLALFLALALLVGTADYEASAIGWMPFLAALFLVAFARVYLIMLTRTLKIDQSAMRVRCQRERDTTFSVTFRNSGMLFFTRIEAYFAIADVQGTASNQIDTTLTLSPRESYQLDFNMRFPHVGTYQAGLQKLIVYDYLGLFSTIVQNDVQNTVQVMPRTLPLQELPFSSDALEEAQAAAKSVLSDSMDYAYVREYEPGDPLKTIHWKLTARLGDPMTRLFERYVNPGVSVLIDFSSYATDEGSHMELLDALVESALSIAAFARREGMEAVISFTDRAGTPASLSTWDDESLSVFVESLPTLSSDASRQQHVVSLLERETTARHGQGNVVICTARLDGQILPAVVEAKSRRRHPLVIAAVPGSLDERERERRCAPLALLDGADIPYEIVSSADDLAEGRLR